MSKTVGIGAWEATNRIAPCLLALTPAFLSTRYAWVHRIELVYRCVYMIGGPPTCD